MTTESPIRYIASLDALRAVAVLLVLVHHWLPEDSVLNSLSNGLMGVTLFFVLSGYLISKILFVQKNSAQNISTVLKVFYLRRALRIFPVYYLVLFILLALGEKMLARDGILSYFLYLQNFRFSSLGTFEWPNAHLWSLAVEEQFYLVWPLILLVVSRKWLSTAIFLLIAIGPASRFLGAIMFESNGLNPEMIHVLMPTTLDCFGLGTLLAYWEIYKPKTFERFTNRPVLLVLTGISLAAYVFVDIGVNGPIHNILLRLLFSVFSLCIIALSLGERLNRLALNKVFVPVLYFGKVSYGVYLFHPYVMILFLHVTSALISADLGWPSAAASLVAGISVLRIPIVFLLTFGVCVLSWELFERPINNLKHRVLYR